MIVRNHKDLDVWQKSIDLVTTIYLATNQFPKEELYTLTSQMRRSAISIPSNIAEGRGKRSTRDFIRYLNIAYGSASELDTQLVIAKNLGYISQTQYDQLCEEIGRICRMLNGMLSGLEKKLSEIPNAECQMLNAIPEAAT